MHFEELEPRPNLPATIVINKVVREVVLVVYLFAASIAVFNLV